LVLYMTGVGAGGFGFYMTGSGGRVILLHDWDKGGRFGLLHDFGWDGQFGLLHGWRGGGRVGLQFLEFFHHRVETTGTFLLLIWHPRVSDMFDDEVVGIHVER